LIYDETNFIQNIRIKEKNFYCVRFKFKNFLYVFIQIVSTIL